MSKGLRILLHILQVLSLLAALLFMAFTFLMTYFDFGGTTYEEHFVGTWAIGFGILAIAFSPALWSLHRGAHSTGAAPVMGGYDRVGPPPPGQQPPPPQRPGGVGFESMSPDRAPAPPASSYGQPSGNFPGGPPPQGGGIAPASPPQGDPPWGSR